MKRLKEIIKSLYYLFLGIFTILKKGTMKKVTLKYPEEKQFYNEKFRGKISLNIKEDNKFDCLGCLICQKVCPVKNLIKIEKEKDEFGKMFVKSYEIDISRCIFCGNCVENCPKKCLIHTKEYELASKNKNTLRICYKVLK